jgi:acetate kinase
MQPNPLAFTVLVLNAGSASLKAALIGASGERLWHGQRSWNPSSGASQADGLRPWLEEVLGPWADKVQLVVHRIVHGGERFITPTRLVPSTIAALEAITPLAPLHNGPALALVHAMGSWLKPDVQQWACFDTAFHHTLPLEARTYALPASWRDQGLRRFGFHGLSHQHIAEVVRVPRLISCHLGGGASLCAIRDGHSIATTMGYTPLEGLVMATRSGSVDPGILLHQLRQGLSANQLEQALSQQSGLLGLSTISGDMHQLRAIATGRQSMDKPDTATQAKNQEDAGLAIAVFRHQLVAGIGAMAACLGGVDAIALTGGIGQNDQALAGELSQALAWLQPFELHQIPADEEGLMARQCQQAASPAPS